jgi:hypothetical protein
MFVSSAVVQRTDVAKIGPLGERDPVESPNLDPDFGRKPFKSSHCCLSAVGKSWWKGRLLVCAMSV